MTMWDESLIRIQWRAIGISFIAKLCSITSRMIVFCVCLSVSVKIFSLICSIHWVIFTIIIFFKVKHLSLIEKCLLSPILSLFYIVTNIKLDFVQNFPNHMIFYFLSFCEGVGMMVTWLFLANRPIWHYYWMSLFVYLCFFIGIFVSRFRYEYDYSKLVPPQIQVRKRLTIYVFNDCLKYPEYDNIKDCEEDEVEERGEK